MVLATKRLLAHISATMANDGGYNGKKRKCFHNFSPVHHPIPILPNKCHEDAPPITTIPHGPSPHDFVIASLKCQGVHVSERQALSMKEDGFFVEPTKEQKTSYQPSIVKAIRTKNLSFLRDATERGRSLQCCNKFGESLVHMACRRSFDEIVAFLVNEAGVSVRICDDFGRTPMHDACFTCEPNFTLMKIMLLEAPELLLVRDKRGHTPLNYARREHWKEWLSFLKNNQRLLLPKDERARKLFERPDRALVED